MPRTIEGIVDAHQSARARISVGLPVWARQIDIKTILRSDPDNKTEEHAASVANQIAAILRAGLPAATLDWAADDVDTDLIEIVEGMESLRPDSYADDPTYSALEDLNNMLDGLYDWADRKRVWLGA